MLLRLLLTSRRMTAGALVSDTLLCTLVFFLSELLKSVCVPADSFRVEYGTDTFAIHGLRWFFCEVYFGRKLHKLWNIFLNFEIASSNLTWFDLGHSLRVCLVGEKFGFRYYSMFCCYLIINF